LCFQNGAIDAAAAACLSMSHGGEALFWHMKIDRHHVSGMKPHPDQRVVMAGIRLWAGRR
jgi:hypothetical protein